MKFGKIHANKDGSAWALSEMPPHVVIRLKDMFKGVRKGDTRQPILMIDRPDVCADLEWFFQRYPFEFADDRAAEVFRERIDQFNATQARLEELSAADWVPGEVIGFRDGEAPEGYQQRAAAIWKEQGSLLLLDDVGLGKTVTSLTPLAEGWGLPAAIVVQPHLPEQWIEDYIRRFTHLRAKYLKTRTPESIAEPFDVYVLKYSNLAAWAPMAHELGIRSVVFDEVQELRHGKGTEKGLAAPAFVEAAGGNVIGLTATPIYNYGSEMWAIADLIRPGCLGTWFEFQTHWCVMHGNHWVVQDPEALGAYMVEIGLALRRTNESPDVSHTLPALQREVLQVEWSEDDAADDVNCSSALPCR